MEEDYVGLINEMLTRAAKWCAAYTVMRWHLGYALDDLFLGVDGAGERYDLYAFPQQAGRVPRYIKIELAELAADHKLALLDTPSQWMLPLECSLDEFARRMACRATPKHVRAHVQAVLDQHAGLYARLTDDVFRRFMHEADPEGSLEAVELEISGANLTKLIDHWRADAGGRDTLA